MHHDEIHVSLNPDFPSLPYTVRRMTKWGLSDASLMDYDPCRDESKYTLVAQMDGANIYISVEPTE